MAPSAVSPAQQHAQPVKAVKDALAVINDDTTGTAPGRLTKPLADLMGAWETFSFAPIRESTVSRAMTSRCAPSPFHLIQKPPR